MKYWLLPITISIFGLLVFSCTNRSIPSTTDGSGPHNEGAMKDANPPKQDQTHPIGIKCRTNFDCPQEEYCFVKSGCELKPDEKGICLLRPTVCQDIWEPVCGCDGQSYENGCTARSNGVNILHEGECKGKACYKDRCKLINDCCNCMAWDASVNKPLPPCDQTCLQPICHAWHFKQPEAYCYKGLCTIKEASKSCKKDHDCKLFNDCCYCMAVPKTSGVPHCDILCDSVRCPLGTVARCINGNCQLWSEKK